MPPFGGWENLYKKVKKLAGEIKYPSRVFTVCLIFFKNFSTRYIKSLCTTEKSRSFPKKKLFIPQKKDLTPSEKKKACPPG